MRYGIVKQQGNLVLVLPSGEGLELRRCKVKDKAKVRQLTQFEAQVANNFVGALAGMQDPEYKRAVYRNVVLEI
jgi:hypothetical protein